jgi:hypothetical protein
MAPPELPAWPTQYMSQANPVNALTTTVLDRDDRRVAALLEAPAGARPFQPWEFVAGEDRDGLVGNAGRLHRSRRVWDLLLAGHLKNCCSARYWLLAYAALYRPSGGVAGVVQALRRLQYVFEHVDQVDHDVDPRSAAGGPGADEVQLVLGPVDQDDPACQALAAPDILWELFYKT